MRQRQGKKAKPAASVEAAPESDGTPRPRAPRNVVRDLAFITFVVAGPYLAYNAYLFILLQSDLFRPHVALNETRQVLIVGLQSSGTTQMTASLKGLGLEIAHENSEASWNFCRDGTISWMHALRFMPPKDEAGMKKSVTLLCRAHHASMGFHPAMFRSNSGCSYRSKWDGCWARECAHIAISMWGCALSEDHPCETPFTTSLLQVRHPLRNAESLVVKFCEEESARPVEPFLVFAHALFPGHPWELQPCYVTMARFWLLYNEAMIQALDRGAIHGFYAVEKTTPCAVASLAGFGEAPYVPSREAYLASCLDADPFERVDPKEVRNRRNKGLVSLSLGNITLADEGLAKDIEALGARFGYDLSY